MECGIGERIKQLPLPLQGQAQATGYRRFQMYGCSMADSFCVGLACSKPLSLRKTGQQLKCRLRWSIRSGRKRAVDLSLQGYPRYKVLTSVKEFDFVDLR